MGDFIAQPLIVVSICIGLLNIIERILRRSTKYSKLLDKIGRSKERLVELSQHKVSFGDNVSEEDILLDCLGLIDDVMDLTDINFKIPS